MTKNDFLSVLQIYNHYSNSGVGMCDRVICNILFKLLGLPWKVSYPTCFVDTEHNGTEYLIAFWGDILGQISTRCSGKIDILYNAHMDENERYKIDGGKM